MNFFKQLKTLSSLALMLLVSIQMQAADIDMATAKNAAKSFMAKQVASGRLNATATNNLKLVKAEASVVNPEAVDYYIFNADKAYVVVAGDDQAPEILMYGASGNLNLDKIPPAMQWLLNKYKYQIDGLKAGTLKPNGYTPKATTAVAPLVTCTWDQTAPYYNHTPTSGSTHAYTGCPATSLSMCFYLYKWPKTYPAMAAIAANNYYGYLAAPALSEKAADWDNMLEHYGTWYDDNGSSHSASYNTTQAEAVSWLMRYVGQACNMGSAPAVVEPPTPRFSRPATPWATPMPSCSLLTSLCHRAGATPMDLHSTPMLNGTNGCSPSCTLVVPSSIWHTISPADKFRAMPSTCLAATPADNIM